MKKPASGRTKTGENQAKRKRRWFGRGVLWVIALLFGISGTIRLVETGGFALAKQLVGAEGGGSDATGDCVTEAGLMALHEQLQVREGKLSEREGLVLDREQAINLAEGRIESRLAELVAAEKALSKTVSIADKSADEDVARLVTLYENMKPKQAAPLFEEMSPEFAAGFLGRMRPDTAAAVMASLTPQTAYTISVMMAGRNAGAPKN